MVQDDREQKVRHSTPMSFEQLQLAALISDEPPLVTEYVPDVYELEEILPQYIQGIYKKALMVRIRTYNGNTYITHLIKMPEIKDYMKDTIDIYIRVIPRRHRNNINDLAEFACMPDFLTYKGKGWVKLQEYTSNEKNK